MPDDFDADITTTGSILIDGSATGEIELAGDQDWFEVILVEDQRYRVEITGTYTDDNDTLSDPFLRGIYDQLGMLVPLDVDDDEAASERNSVMEFVAGASGIHFLSASGYNLSTGSYTISISDLGPDDDFSADTSTTGSAFSGGSSFGTFEFAEDQDWFEIYLDAGFRYQFQLFGDGTGAWADASNLILGSLYDENGDIIPNTGENLGENGGFVVFPVQSFFEFEAPSDGFYYISAETFDGNTGRYQLDVTDLGFTDDHPADFTTTASVLVDGSFAGEIDAHGDEDWISVFLLAGNVYDISVSGDGSGLGTLPTPNITEIIDTLGNPVPYSHAGDGFGDTATLRYLAPLEGTYYISVGSIFGDIGTYTVSVTNPFEVDDHGDNATTDTELLVGGSQMGFIGDATDLDVFYMSLVAGQIYQINMDATALVDPLDTLIQGIYSYSSHHFAEFSDNLILGTDNDDFGPSTDSQVTFTAPFTGDFFLAVTGATGGIGDYQVQLTQVGVATDDFGNDQTSLGTVSVSGTVDGFNETESDEDWFAMSLQAGQIYRLTAFEDQTNRSDFSSMGLRIFDQTGVEVLDGVNLVFSGLTTRLEFTPDSTDVYYAVVGDDSLVNGTGNYTLQLDDIGSVDDYASDITTTGDFFFDGMDNTYVYGEIETDGDEDWFAISLVDGHSYAINLKGAETGEGTLEDPNFAGVYDSLGVLVGAMDDNGGEGLNSYQTYTADYTGTHYFAVSAPISEGFSTGTYVLQVDDLGLGGLPALRQDVLNEGTTLDFEVTFEDFGFDRGVVFDWDITSLSFSGDATFTVDYFLSGTENENLDVSISVFDDPLVEDDETAIIDVVGFIDWIAPVSDGFGSTFLNVNGESVFGQIERAVVDEQFVFTLNSAPEGATTPITDYVFDGPEVVGNVLTNFTDGSGELFSVEPLTFDLGGSISGSIDASGDITVTGSTLPPEAVASIGFTVVDSRGATTLGNQDIVFAAESDDFLPGPTATFFGSLDIGVASTGTIEEPGDRDRFNVLLEAGTIYSLSAISGGTSEPLSDPEIVGVFDSLGGLIPGTSDDNGGSANDALVAEFTVPVTDTYQVEIAGSGDLFTGEYAVEINSLGVEDDFLPGDFAEALGSIAVGQSQTGLLEIPTDRDRFAVDLEAGQLYTISVQGEATGAGTLANPDLIGVFDGQGQLVAGSSDADSGSGLNALVTGFEVLTDGTFEIEVGNLLEDAGGTYTLSVIGDGFVDDFLPGVTATSLGSVEADGLALGTISFDGDRDRFQVNLTAGEIYAINLFGVTSEGGTLADPEIIGLFDPQGDLVDGTSDNNGGDGTDAAVPQVFISESGTYEIEVAGHTDIGTGSYTLTVDRLGVADDFLPGDFASIVGAVEVDGTATGDLEVEGDRDRFEVTLQAGITYGIGVEGFDTSVGSLSNPAIVGLFTQSGDLIAGTSDDDSGLGRNALLTGVTVEADGTYILEVGSSGDLDVGTYQVNVDFESYLDDFLPGVAGDFGDVTVGGSATGTIDNEADTDRFRVTLDADTTYQINLRGSDTDGGTLPDPRLIGVFDAQGNGPLGQSADDDSGQGLDSLSTFTPPESGTYFIEVAGFDGDTGTFTVSIDELGLVDDFAADVTTVGDIVPGGTSTGTIDFTGDEDWFETTLTSGRIYQIDLTTGVGDAPLSDPRFLGVYDSQGNVIPNTFNDDGGDGNNSRLTFVPDETGTFFLSAGGFLEETGDYQLAVSDLGDPGDTSGFDITLNFVGDDKYRAAFDAAAQRWEEVITGDLPFAFVSDIGLVDDILIDVSLVDVVLDFPGVGQDIIAISRVLEQRETDEGGLPSHSSIIVNQSQADRVFQNLDDLAANAIGRALGFGSLWQEFGLTLEFEPGVLSYVGSNALREFAEMSGSANGTILLDDGSTGGLAGAYWSEAVLTSELMTPSIGFRNANGPPRPDNAIDNPLSTLTIGAMADLGYVVNYGAADPYTYSPTAFARASASSETPTAAAPAAASAAPQEEHGFALSDDGAQPNGPTYTYFRANALSESPSSVPLTDQNTQLLSAGGEAAELLIGIPGQNFLLDLTGAFAKTNPTTVSQLSGEVSSIDVFNLGGDLVLRLDHSQKPLQVSDLLADWPAYPFSDENILLVEDLPGTNARINPGDQSQDARILTEAGEDFVQGGAAAELIDGGDADDILRGAAGNDTLIGGSGLDFLDGGEGVDTAQYSGNQAAYTLTLSPDDTLLEDRRADGDGMDRLVNVERLQFETNLFGSDFNLERFGGPTGLSAAQFESFIELYIAYFNRAPDAIGLNFWGTAFANGTTLPQMATLFIDQEETAATYPPGQSNADFATEVYTNVLGRVPDLAGFNFWVGVLDSGSVGRDQFILSVLDGAKADPPDGASQEFIDQQQADRQYLTNKIDIGAYFAVHKGMSDLSNARDAMGHFDGSQSSIDAAVAAIEGFEQSALDPASGEFLMPIIGVLDDPFSGF